MIDEQLLTGEIEAERYELFETPNYNIHFDRRDFIKAFGLGIVFIVPAARTLAQQRGQDESGRGGSNRSLPQDIDAWIHIDEKGEVTAFTGKVEVGQNTRTTLTQSVADELHVPVGSVHLVMGDTDLTPFDMGTFGSRSTPTMAPQLQKAAAAAREMLIAMAAEQLSVAPNDLRIVDARFLNHDKSKTLTLAEVAKGKIIVRGWWAVPPGACARAVTTPLAGGAYSLFVRHKDGKPIAEGPEKFCIAAAAFENQQQANCAARGQTEAGFQRTPTNGAPGFVAHVGDKGLLPGGAPARP